MPFRCPECDGENRFGTYTNEDGKEIGHCNQPGCNFQWNRDNQTVETSVFADEQTNKPHQGTIVINSDLPLAPKTGRSFTLKR